MQRLPAGIQTVHVWGPGCRGGLGTAGWMVGLSDPRELFQHFCDSSLVLMPADPAVVGGVQSQGFKPDSMQDLEAKDKG